MSKPRSLSVCVLRRSKLIEAWGKIFAIFFGIITILTVIIGYYKEAKKRQIDNSLSLGSEYSQKYLSDKRESLLKFFLNIENNENNFDGSHPSEFSTQYVRNNNLEASLYTILSFFRRVNSCVDTSRCDAETACALFRIEFATYRTVFYYPINLWRDSRLRDDSLDILRKFEGTCKSLDPLTRSRRGRRR